MKASFCFQGSKYQYDLAQIAGHYAEKVGNDNLFEAKMCAPESASAFKVFQNFAPNAYQHHSGVLFFYVWISEVWEYGRKIGYLSKRLETQSL